MYCYISFISSINCQTSIIHYYTFAVDYPRLKELWYVEYNAEEEDRDEVEADSLADRAGLGKVPVGVGVADSAVPQTHNNISRGNIFTLI